MIELVNASIRGQTQKALLGEEVVELEFSEPDIQPGALKQVVEAYPGRFEMERARLVRRRHE